MEFVDAEYVAPAGGPGRNAGPNPYTDVVAAIALKTVEKNGKKVPVAKAVKLNHAPGDDAAKKKVVDAAKRKLSQAGEKNDPPVSVISVPQPFKTGTGKAEKTHNDATLLTFWTVPRQTRKPKVKTPEAVADKATV